MSLTKAKTEIARMLKNSQTKVIVPVITLGLIRKFLEHGQLIFTDAEVRKAYESAVGSMQRYLGHDVHIGGKYYDAYGSRMSRYGVLEQVAHLEYRLLPTYSDEAAALNEWIPTRIKEHIDVRLGIVPLLGEVHTRAELSASRTTFVDLIREHIRKTPSNFEIFSFAVIKVHLEKFACRIYRDTRASARDAGVDLSTNFGVVYQVKRLTVSTVTEAAELFSELKANFDRQRLQDGNVILVIDDFSREVKDFLIDARIQSISREDILGLASGFDCAEDRQKVLRIIYEEFRREYSSQVAPRRHTMTMLK